MVSNIFYVHPYLGRFPFWLIFFKMGWFNHQLENLYWRLRFRTHESLEHLVMMERSIDRSPKGGGRVWDYRGCCWSSILTYENKWSWWFSRKLGYIMKIIHMSWIIHLSSIYFSVICHDMSLFVQRMCLNRFGVCNFQPTRWASELIFIQRGAGSL